VHRIAHNGYLDSKAIDSHCTVRAGAGVVTIAVTLTIFCLGVLFCLSLRMCALRGRVLWNLVSPYRRKVCGCVLSPMFPLSLSLVIHFDAKALGIRISSSAITLRSFQSWMRCPDRRGKGPEGIPTVHSSIYASPYYCLGEIPRHEVRVHTWYICSVVAPARRDAHRCRCNSPFLERAGHHETPSPSTPGRFVARLPLA